MANELMQKVGELLGIAGVDEEIIKSVTEKLSDENVVLEEESIKHEEAGRGTENAPVDGKINKGGEKVEKEEAEDEEKAPVDPKANVGGYNAVKEEVDEACDCGKKECKKEEDDEVEMEKADENLQEALEALLGMVKEAYEQTKQMRADFDVLKEEYAKLIAEKIIAEANETEEETPVKEAEDEKEEDSHEAEEKNAEEHEEAVKAHVEDEEAKKDEEKGEKEDAKKEEKKADEEGKDMRNNMEKEKKDYDEAHESLDETANKIAEDVTTITEETVVVEPKTVKIAKAYSVFSSNISESVGTDKKQRKAFTLFPNL